MKQLFLAIFITVNILTVSAQQVLLEKTGTDGLCNGAISIVDINNSGKMNVIFSGKSGTETSSANATYVYSGDGSGTFTLTENTNSFLGGASQYWIWEDFDGDGELDLFNSGVTVARASGYANLYLMSDEYCLETYEPFSAKPTRQYGGAHVMADLDNDGLFDFIHSFDAEGVVDIVRFQDTQNDSVSFCLGDITIKTDHSTPVKRLTGARISLTDFNQDGLIDFILSGHVELPSPKEKYVGLFINNGDRTFTEQQFTDIYNGTKAASMFADIDGDGLCDLVQAVASNNYYLSYYKNVGGVLTLRQRFSEEYQPVSVSDFATIADINNDGYSDIIITGATSGTTSRKTAFYIYNPATDLFELDEELTNAIPGLYYSVVEVIDADGDGILDFAIQGIDNNNVLRYGIYKNTRYTASNTPPTVPVNLANSIKENNTSQVTLSWGAATDDKTPAASLTYNLYLRNTTTGKYIIHPKADITTGKRQVYAQGNAYMAKTKTMTLPDGDYEWSVQAIDAAYAGGEFAPVKTFTIGDNSSDKVLLNDSSEPVVITKDGTLRIESRDNVESIKLYSSTGVLLDCERNRNTLSCPTTPGTYVVRIQIEGKVFTKKLSL